MKQPDTPYLFTIEEALVPYCLKYGTTTFTMFELYRIIHNLKKTYSGLGYIGRPFKHSKYVGELNQFSVQIIKHFESLDDIFTVLYPHEPINAIIALKISTKKLINMIKLGAFSKDWRFPRINDIPVELITAMRYQLKDKNLMVDVIKKQ